ncbi:hypothetical protein ACFX15_000243 [Malus domestica]
MHKSCVEREAESSRRRNWRIQVAFLISGLIFLLTHKSKSKHPNLPPGPPRWLIVGNLFQFACFGKPFFQYADDLQLKYGPIFTLKMGTRTMIILNDAKLVHEALIEKGTANQVATIMHVEMYVWEDRDCEPRKLLLLGQFCQ